VRQLGGANIATLVSDDLALGTTEPENDLERKRQGEASKLRRMGKVHNGLKMWQGCECRCATLKESRAQNKQMMAVGYISDTEEIVKQSWSKIQHDGAAAFKLLERSPLTPTLSTTDLPGGRTQVLNVHQIKRIDHHPAKNYEDIAPASIFNTENWLDWNSRLDNHNVSEDHWEVDNEADMELDNGIEDLQSQWKWDVSDAPHIPALIRPTQRSKHTVEKLFMPVNTIVMMRNKGNMKK